MAPYSGSGCSISGEVNAVSNILLPEKTLPVYPPLEFPRPLSYARSISWRAKSRSHDLSALRHPSAKVPLPTTTNPNISEGEVGHKGTFSALPSMKELGIPSLFRDLTLDWIMQETSKLLSVTNKCSLEIQEHWPNLVPKPVDWATSELRAKFGANTTVLATYYPDEQTIRSYADRSGATSHPPSFWFLASVKQNTVSFSFQAMSENQLVCLAQFKIQVCNLFQRFTGAPSSQRRFGSSEILESLFLALLNDMPVINLEERSDSKLLPDSEGWFNHLFSVDFHLVGFSEEMKPPGITALDMSSDNNFCFSCRTFV